MIMHTFLQESRREEIDIEKIRQEYGDGKVKQLTEQLDVLSRKYTVEVIREGLQKHSLVPVRYIEAEKVHIKSSAWDQVRGFLQGESLYIHGKAGRGKTYLAVALLKELMKLKKPFIGKEEGYANILVLLPSFPIMLSAPELLMEIRECFKEKSTYSEKDIIDAVSNIECLFLDDLGAEKTSEWSLQTLYTIIDRRYRDMKHTLITSNLNLRELADKVGERISSRIAGMCRCIELTGKDRRLERANV